MTRSIPTVALVLDYLVSGYQVGLTRAIERVTKARGLSLLTFVGRAFNPSSAADTTQNRIYELITQQVVDGIIFLSGCVSHTSGPTGLASHCRRYQPIPICSIGIELPDIPSLIISNEQGFRALVEHLIVRHGASRIAYLGGPVANYEAADRYRGFCTALGRHGLTVREQLVEHADFSLPGGAAAMKRILSRSINFDAVVAANDYMALGAMQALRAQGLRVPNDVLLAGFDDVQLSRFSLPALTTVRQPIESLARRAVELLLDGLSAKAMPLVSTIDVELVTRASCGCATSAQRYTQSLLPENSRPDITFSVMRHRDAIIKSLQNTVSIPVEALGGWAGRLLDALHADLTTSAGRFLEVFTLMLEEAEPHAGYIDELGKVVALLRGELKRLRPLADVGMELEHIWYGAQVAVGNAVTNVQGREKMELQEVVEVVRDGFERIGTALSRPTLHQGVVDMLRDLEIRHACVGLVDGEYSDRLVPFVNVTTSRPSVPAETDGFPESQLVPTGFWGNTRHSHVVLPLSFERDYFGVLVMEYATNEPVFGLVRDHISSALKAMSLRAMALHERAEHEQLEQEAKRAARLQTAILKHPPKLSRLDVCARMLAVSQLRPDYYDLMAVDTSVWLTLGTLAGCDPLGGLASRILQAMVSALVQHAPCASPAELMRALDRSLGEDLRNRLKLGSTLRLILLRVDNDGSALCAGAHDQILLWRAQSSRVESVRGLAVSKPTGSGVIALTADSPLKLEVGDLMLLFSEGVTNTRNETGECLGIERLGTILAAAASQPTEKINQVIIRAIEQWQSRQVDDLTIVVLRYEGERAG